MLFYSIWLYISFFFNKKRLTYSQMSIWMESKISNLKYVSCLSLLFYIFLRSNYYLCWQGFQTWVLVGFVYLHIFNDEFSVNSKKMVFYGWFLEREWSFSGQEWYSTLEGFADLMGARNVRVSLTPLHAEMETLLWAIECMKNLR